MVTDSVLLICLTPQESNYIQQLLSSFEIEIESKDICPIEEASLYLDDANLCMVILHLDEKRKSPVQEIRQIRNMLSRPIPMLILISPDLTRNIKQYLSAGADDYWVLPIDETTFSIRFYVLLEWGEAILHSSSEPAQQKAEQSDNPSISYKNLLWQRILNRLQDGLRFFSPGALIQRQSSPMNYKWERVRHLGSGGFGDVWLVRDQKKKNLAVAKIPHSPKMNIRSLRSAAILKRLTLHPHIVQLIEVIKEEGKVILIQEYVPGTTMQELLEAGMNAVQKEKAFLQLLDTITYAHQHKIMHRDIKPENIIITPLGELKLLDFGIAKDLSRQRIGITVVGSYPFMAPEQIMGKSCLASDVWSMGVMLYLFSTKCLPFFHDNEKYLMDMILETHPTRPRDLDSRLPEKLEHVILKAIEKDTEKRYVHAGELRIALLNACPDFGKGNILPD